MVNEELPQMERAEAEKVRNHRFYFQGFIFLQETVRVLLDPERGAASLLSGTAANRVSP